MAYRCNTLNFVKSDSKDIYSCLDRAIVHKSAASFSPLVSFILLDWNCRERFHTLDWLNSQSVDRTLYELIWIDLYERVVPEVVEKADIVATCQQKGMYHKHKGYNVGFLLSKGRIVIVCDSDAVFPPNFVQKVLERYGLIDQEDAVPLTLMFHEWRTASLYPEGLQSTDGLQQRFDWWPLIPNAGACACFRREDVIRYGGFDEDEAFRGYMCGPYDLVWRLVNAGLPEEWHDERVALWHFAHPDPVTANGFLPNFSRSFENMRPHVDGHALLAVEAFATGRILPVTENAHIWHLRMQDRRIGSEFEMLYGSCLRQSGIVKKKYVCMQIDMAVRAFLRVPYMHLKQHIRIVYQYLKVRLGVRRIAFKIYVKRVLKTHPRVFEVTKKIYKHIYRDQKFD